MGGLIQHTEPHLKFNDDIYMNILGNHNNSY